MPIAKQARSKRSLHLFAALAAVTALPFLLEGTASAAEFDDAANGLKLDASALRSYAFESDKVPDGLGLASWQRTQNFPSIDRGSPFSAAALTKRLTEGADAIEGSHALRFTNGEGLSIVDPALFAQVAKGKLEVSLWARADGAPPQLHVLYDNGPKPQLVPFALVRGIRTGRETTDGWAEYSTGPIDGSVWGVPIQTIAVVPSSEADAKAAFLIDALEIRKVDGAAMEPKACTQANVDTVCGVQGDCMYGRCVSATATWGALPAPAHRAEIAERWIQYATRFMGDRNSVKKGIAILTPQARALAKDAPSSRQFFGGLSHLVNQLRDNHTSFGSPANYYTSFAPQVGYPLSGALGACFGVMEKDLLGGGLAFGVFRARSAGGNGSALQTGDIVTAIDGIDPKKWVDDVWPRYANALGNDPESDWGASANDLSRLLAQRASNVTFARCASPTACDGGDRQTFTVDVAAAAFTAATTGGAAQASHMGEFACSQRFRDAVDQAGGGGGQEDKVSTKAGNVGETRVQFDGFVGFDTWKKSMSDVFSGRPAKVMMDARMGHGGYYDTVEFLFNLLRGSAEPMGVFAAGRGTYDLTDPPWLFSRFSTCVGQQADMWRCFVGNSNGFFAQPGNPPGAGTKIAWLNTYDVSANDFMPRLLKGRSNVRIFAPHPTSGAFGSVSSLPPIATGYSGGSLQVQDSKFASSIAGAEAARWESGHGVVPDQVVTQKQSDALRGTDTILESAAAWLAAP